MQNILTKAQQTTKSFIRYSCKCKELELMLINIIQFDFSIDFRDDEGLVICRNETADLALFSNCMKQIAKYGFLDISLFNNWTM